MKNITAFKKCCCVVAVVLLIVLFYSAPYILGRTFMGEPSKELLLQSVSPDNQYTLSAYRIDGGATTDYAIEVYIDTENNDKLIYDAYHENKVEIYWINDSKVSINDKVLDLSEDETYDWRHN